MYVAMDQHYVTKDIFDSIYQQADKTAKMISGLITYLWENEKRFKREKLNKPEKPDKRKNSTRSLSHVCIYSSTR
jgi:hypothetical protein